MLLRIIHASSTFNTSTPIVGYYFLSLVMSLSHIHDGPRAWLARLPESPPASPLHLLLLEDQYLVVLNGILNIYEY